MRERLKELKEKYPLVQEIRVEYQGSGDSFEEFWDITIDSLDNVQQNISIDEIQDVLWFAIEGSEADFNNEGSEGTITINLENLTLDIDNYYIVYDKVEGGSNSWDFKDEELCQG